MTLRAKTFFTLAAFHVVWGCSKPATLACVQTPPANRVSTPARPDLVEPRTTDILAMNDGFFCLTRDVRAHIRHVGILNSAEPFTLDFFKQYSTSPSQQKYFVTLPKNQLFSSSVTLASSGATAVFLGDLYILEDHHAIRSLEDGRRGKSQACSIVGTRVDRLLGRAADSMQLVSPATCRHRRYLDRLADTDCRFVKDRQPATARLNVGFDTPSSRIGSLVVASRRLGIHILHSKKGVDCSPVQVKSKDQSLVASLATMPAVPDPDGYSITEFEAEGCVGVVVGTIFGQELTQSGLQALLDSVGDS